MIKRNRAVSLVLVPAAVIACCLSALLATPQERSDNLKKKSVDELLADLKQHPGSLGAIHRLRVLNSKKAIPGLREEFQKAPDKIVKQAAAAALVSLKATEREYWDYLVRHALQAVESDAPTIVAYENGKAIRGKTNPEFVVWCKKKRLDPQAAALESTYVHPTDVLFLALANDARAIPVFLKGLNSGNFLIAARSAQGLARLGYKPAAEHILNACDRVPPEAASLVAESLAFFEDRKAHQAVLKHVRDEKWQALRTRAKAKGSAGVFDED